MIPEYKLYHGAVLAELVDHLPNGVAIDELREDGRLTSYVLDNRVGLHVKHSMQRLSPWQFTFTAANVAELGFLQMTHNDSFVVLVCRTDGMVCLTIEELKSVLAFGAADQAWVRVSRHRRELYSVAGGASELSRKKPDGLDPIVQCLSG
jgi:hypothetical protein